MINVTVIPVMSRHQLLAAALPVEDRRVGVEPNGSRHPVVYRFATEEERARFLEAEREVLAK
jgi:hypothetical protein